MKKKFEATTYDLNEYPEVDENAIKFPSTIYIAYVVCGKKCGARGFLAEGLTQVCNNCGKLMFRTITKEYRLIED